MNSLISANIICKEKIKSLEPYELIEKVIFDKDKIEEIGQLLNKEFAESWYDWDKVYSVKETITMFLVGCAKYFYNDHEGGFWDAVKNILGIRDCYKMHLIKAFNSTLSLNSLQNFNDEKVAAFTQIGSILAHAGLPEGLEDTLIKYIARLRFYDIPFDRLGEECIDNCFITTKSLISYLNIMNKLGLLNDFIYDVLQLLNNKDNEVDDNLSIAETLQLKIIKFKSSTDYTNGHETSQKITRPTLNYDIDSNLVYIEIPELRNETSPKLKIQVRNGESVIDKNLYENGFELGSYIFRSSILKIEPNKKILIYLFDDMNNELWHYELKKEEEYILFNSKGEYIKNRYLPSKGGFILIDNDYVPQNDQDLIQNFEDVNIFVQPETDIDTIVFNNDYKTIKIPLKKPIEIIDGEKLFGENCKFKGIDAYYKLPNIKVPIIDEWTLSISVNDSKTIYNLNEETYTINLCDFIEENQFGKIAIRLFNKTLGYKTFKFLYLPYVEKDVSNYFPSYDGFKQSKVSFKLLNSNIKILNTNLKETNELICKEDEDKVFGIYELNQIRYEFSIMIRPFSWKIENNNNLMFLPNTKGYLSLNDLTKFGDCILTFRNNTDKKFYIKINNNKEDSKYIKIYPNSKRIISLKEYFEFIANSEKEALIYIEQDYKKICDICSFRMNLAITNLHVSSFSNDYEIILWEEDGLKINRELRCRYIDRPYEYFVISIPNGQTMMSIDKNDDQFCSNFIAEIALKKDKNIFNFEENEKIEILDSSNSVIVNLYDNKKPYVNFNIENENEFNNCLYSYLTYRFNKKLIPDDVLYKKIIAQLLYKLISARIIYGDEIIIQNFLKYNIDKNKFEIILNDLRMYMPILTNYQFSTSEYKQIERFNPYIYVVYSLIKCDYNQIDKLLLDNCSYFDRFKDKELFMFAHKYELFKDIDDIESFKPYIKNAKLVFNNKKEEELYLMVLIDFLIKKGNKFSLNDIKLIDKLSGYIKNIYNKYPNKLVNEIFVQTSRRK